MSGLTASLIVAAALGPCRAPVPAAPAPDPSGRGYLGVFFATAPGQDSLAVGKLADNMPAAKAGIQVGDVVVRVNSFRPTQQQELIAHIMAYRPGAAVEVEVRRGAATKTFRVKLAARPDTSDLGLPLPVQEVLPILPRP